jgi:hypothetical protein
VQFLDSGNAGIVGGALAWNVPNPIHNKNFGRKTRMIGTRGERELHGKHELSQKRKPSENRQEEKS